MASPKRDKYLNPECTFRPATNTKQNDVLA